MAKTKTRDMELYEAWVANKTPHNMERLLDELEGITYTAASRFSMGHIPKASLRIKARTLAAKAIETYDSDSGVKLSVWVTTYLDKLNRFVGKGSVTHISEDMHNLQTNYYREKSILEQQLNRVPTVAEIADTLGIPVKKVLTLERTFSPIYNDSVLNTNKYMGATATDEEDIEYVFHQLSEDDQRLFSMKTGWPGGKPMNLEAIGSKLRLSPAQVSRRLAVIADKIKIMLHM